MSGRRNLEAWPAESSIPPTPPLRPFTRSRVFIPGRLVPVGYVVNANGDPTSPTDSLARPDDAPTDPSSPTPTTGGCSDCG